jgi:ATP-binding cassette, subfamily B, bacterial
MRDVLRSYRDLLRMAWREHPLKIMTAVLLELLGGLAGPLVAVALRAATEAATTRDISAATTAGLVIGVGVIGLLLLSHFAYFAFAETSEAAAIGMEAELMTLVNGSARLDHHERPEYADKITVLRRELGGLQDGVQGLLQMLTLTVSLGVTAVLLAFVNPWLLLLPVMAVPSVLASRRATAIVDRGKEASAADTRASWHLFHLATRGAPAKELRVLRLQEEIRRRNARLWDSAGRTLLVAERRATLLTAAGQLIFALGYVIAVLIVVRQAVAGHSGVGDVILVITLAAQVNGQVGAAVLQLRNLQQVAHGLTRLRWLRQLIANQQPPPADVPVPHALRTGIELRDVDFAYPGTDRPVLTGVNLFLPAGSTVAIVGENGSGKTTLVKLLCRFYEATSGVITVDSVDLRRLPLDGWRDRIAAGFQDFVRFELLARQTIGLGDLPLLDDEPAVRAALDRAHAGDVIDRLDDGLATQLGRSHTDGAELSGGQWQKLALGRAMMRKSPLLLILDEPTAALDAEAEHQLFEQYAANARRVGRDTGAITVLVSHRFSTVRMADLIVVVADGRIAESGSHDTLMAAHGLYAELYDLQAAAFQPQ